MRRRDWGKESLFERVSDFLHVDDEAWDGEARDGVSLRCVVGDRHVLVCFEFEGFGGDGVGVDDPILAHAIGGVVVELGGAVEGAGGLAQELDDEVWGYFKACGVLGDAAFGEEGDVRAIGCVGFKGDVGFEHSTTQFASPYEVLDHSEQD